MATPEKTTEERTAQTELAIRGQRLQIMVDQKKLIERANELSRNPRRAAYEAKRKRGQDGSAPEAA